MRVQQIRNPISPYFLQYCPKHCFSIYRTHQVFSQSNSFKYEYAHMLAILFRSATVSHLLDILGMIVNLSAVSLIHLESLQDHVSQRMRTFRPILFEISNSPFHLRMPVYRQQLHHRPKFRIHLLTQPPYLLNLPYQHEKISHDGQGARVARGE